MGITGAIAGFITAVIAAGGYGGIALLMAIESACIPLPSEVIMPFAGYLAGTGRFNLWLVALSGAAGCNLGSIPAYWVGAHGGRALVARHGRWVLAGTAELDQAERFFARFGGAAVLLARLLPVVRTFIALPAGMARMKLLPFHLYTFAGSFLWCLLLAWIGRALGSAWDRSPTLHAVMHRLDLAVVAVLLVGGAWYVISHWRRARG